MDKKKLLFIDHDILLFDQFAGSRSNYMYLKLFLEMGLSVTFICSSFRNIEPYTSHMKGLGIKVLTGPVFRKIWKLWFRVFGKQFDYVFFNKPLPTRFFLPYVEQHTNASLLYQCHDLHYLRLRRQYELERNQATLDQSREMEKLETDIARRTDIFLTFSWHEKDLIEEKFTGVKAEVVPLYFYDRLTPPITDFSQCEGLLYVGGFKHTPNVDAVLWFVREVLPAVIRANPEIRFYIAGSSPPEKIKELESEHVQVLGYVTDDELAELYARVRLAVIPLRYGAGVKGKTMEAVHHSLPLVSTGIGVEGINLDSIIPPTDSSEDFSNRINALYQDEEELKKISSDLHAYAKEHLSEAAVKKLLLRLFESLK